MLIHTLVCSENVLNLDLFGKRKEPTSLCCFRSDCHCEGKAETNANQGELKEETTRRSGPTQLYVFAPSRPELARPVKGLVNETGNYRNALRIFCDCCTLIDCSTKKIGHKASNQRSFLTGHRPILKPSSLIAMG